MKGLFKSTLASIDQGLSGRLLTIPTGLPKYDDYIYGTRKACYYLYGGETGTGKTIFVREKHIYKVYDHYKLIGDPTKLDVRFLDFSLEISAQENMAAAVSRKLYLDDGRVVPPEKLFGYGSKIDNSTYQKIQSYTPYFEEFEDKLFVYDEETTPTKFHDIIMAYAKSVGKFKKEGRWISECEGYEPENPNLYSIIVIDTINLSDIEPTHESVKSSIDRISRLCVWFRNKCGFTPIIIQQFNAEISAVDRNRYGIKTPLLRDFEDSKRTTKDANVVVGIFDPMRHMKEDDTLFYGYDITILKSWFRSLHLLKHRNGQSNKFIPLQYKGAVGMFDQLPEPKDMGPDQYTMFTRY
jgi:hypothetical protein